MRGGAIGRLTIKMQPRPRQQPVPLVGEHHVIELAQSGDLALHQRVELELHQRKQAVGRFGIVNHALRQQHPIAVGMNIMQANAARQGSQRPNQAAVDVELEQLAVVSKTRPAIFQGPKTPPHRLVTVIGTRPSKQQ